MRSPRPDIKVVRVKPPRDVVPEADVAGYDTTRLKLGKELEDLTQRDCHWPLNNGGPYIFCGAKVSRDHYCEIHNERATRLDS
jgi:GcrA cell cycle regulator